MNNIMVKIPGVIATQYPVIIGNNLLQDFYEYFHKYSKGRKILVVTNTTVKNLYGKFFHNEDTSFVILEDGEQYKNIKSYEKIINKACEINLERQDAIVALGGGVVGDLAGFAAATYLRGVDFIQVPTTLLAMVDSSIGGKTGFNNPFGKNLIGAFYQPKFVLSDVSTLKTLNKKQLSSGFGEIIKYGFIEKNCGLEEDINLASYLLENTNDVVNLKEDILIEIIKACVHMKGVVVSKDEKETDLRRILNFGHTIGHAIEKSLGYKNITHGQAIVHGMKIMFNYSVKSLLIDDLYRNNAFKLMDLLILDNTIPKINFKELETAMFHDKKMVGNKINFVIPTSKREVTIVSDINYELLKIEIQKYFNI